MLIEDVLSISVNFNLSWVSNMEHIVKRRVDKSGSMNAEIKLCQIEKYFQSILSFFTQHVDHVSYTQIVIPAES